MISKKRSPRTFMPMPGLVVADCVTSPCALQSAMTPGLDVVAPVPRRVTLIGRPGLGSCDEAQRSEKPQETLQLPKFYSTLATYRKATAKEGNPFTLR